MGIKCIFGHKWEENICKNCNIKLEDFLYNEKDLDKRLFLINSLSDDPSKANLIKSNIKENEIFGIELEKFILSKNGLIDRAFIIHCLSQEALVYLIKKTKNYSIIDLAIKKVEDDNIAVDLILPLDNRDLRYSVLLGLIDSDLIKKFLKDKDSTVSQEAMKRYEIVKLSDSELLDYKKNHYNPNFKDSKAQFLERIFEKRNLPI